MMKIDNPNDHKIRRAPYAEPKFARGVALLLYRGKRRTQWGCRTPLGDRTIGDTATMSYGEACDVVKRMWQEEQACGVKVMTDPAAVQRKADATTFGEVWSDYLAEAEKTKTPAAVALLYSHGRLIERLANRQVATTPVKDLNKWRANLIGTNGRTVASMGRVIASLLAALNGAGIDGPWREFKKFKSKGDAKKVAKEREIVALTGEDRDRFIAAAYDISAHFGTLVQALALTGCRPSELRLANVRDLQPDGLLIRHSKTGKRTMTLSRAARAFFMGITKGANPNDPLLGYRWKDGEWRSSVEKARKATGHRTASLYSMRHGMITEAIYARIPILKIAEQAGTSVAMIEETYAHAIGSLDAEIWNEVGPSLLRVAGGAA